jgi:hypothetical protein
MLKEDVYESASAFASTGQGGQSCLVSQTSIENRNQW